MKKYRVVKGGMLDMILKNIKPLAVLASAGLIIGGMAAAQLAFAADEPVEAQKPVTVKAAAESLSETVSEPSAVIWAVPLEEELQLYIAGLCEEYHIQPELVLAVIEQESQYNPEAIGDSGNSLGLMQVQPRWHSERMQQLGCTDLLNPYENVVVGIDILSEKLEKYGDVEKALCAYNSGDAGAERLYFSNGIYSSDYSRKVVERCQELKCNQCK